MKYLLVYEDKNQNCRIIVPDGSFQQHWEDDEQAIARLHDISIPDCVEFIACKPDLIPQDKTFRNAWKKGDINEPIKIDLKICIEIHRERIKECATRKIIKLGKELEIAIENDNLPLQVAINKTKKILRNIHESNLSHCNTPDEVKYAIIPELYDVWDLYPPRRII